MARMDWSVYNYRFLNWEVLSVLGATLVGLSLTVPAIAYPEQVASGIPLAQASSQSASDLSNQAKMVLQLWADQKFAEIRPYLSADLQTLLPVEELRRFSDVYIADVGRIKSMGKARVIDANPADFVIIPVNFEKTTANVVVTFDENGKIAGINFPTQATIQELAEQSVEAITKGDLVTARDRFSPDLKSEISPQVLEQKWLDLQRSTGSFKRIVGSEVREGSATDVTSLVLVTIEFDRVTDDLILIFDRQKQIVGVDFPVQQ